MGRADPAPARRAGPSVRCAIYTRKSSEEGLEQDFNSLHAQREACEAFIRSQRHEGWTCRPGSYDDGGISGATLERPALQQLLSDIRARKVDVVVVYKVDRLTRSLTDFAKIVEIFDGHGVSFVSVTQQFNTTSSMGRLTLNVLLSFAQFEREVTGERIRDKIAASKQKGMWMGGTPPLGYDARDRALVVNQPEADTVCHIFRRYLALGSVRLLMHELARNGIASKAWVTTSGRRWGGRPIARGALYHMLQNRLYLGEIVHKGQTYPGQHAPILDRPLFEEVQARLTANAGERRAGGGSRNPSLLAGLLFDGDGHRMTPTHATKHGKRYRYYISRPLITDGRASRGRELRAPAAELEQLVADRVRTFLADASALFDAVRTTVADPADQRRIVHAASALAAAWTNLAPLRLRRIHLELISRIDLTATEATIHVRPSRVADVVDPPAAEDRTDVRVALDEHTIALLVPAHLKRIGQGAKLILDGPNSAQSEPNPSMVRLLVQAHRLQEQLLQGKHAGAADMAAQERVTGSYIARLLRLSWLAPDIRHAILVGNHPPALTATRLMQGPLPPLDWQAQRATFGFA